MCSSVSSKTVSLESAAYERLRAAKYPGESFSQAVNRILEGSQPSFRALAGALRPSEARKVQEAIGQMRANESPAERERLLRLQVVNRGSRPRH
jgi:predicted CopG family antitoxin